MTYVKDLNQINNNLSCQCDLSLSRDLLLKGKNNGIDYTINNGYLKKNEIQDDNMNYKNFYAYNSKNYFMNNNSIGLRFLQEMPNELNFLPNQCSTNFIIDKHEPFYNYYPKRLIEYNSQKQQKLSFLKEKLLDYKTKSKSPELAEVKYNAHGIIDFSKFINSTKLLSENKISEMRKIYKLERNEQKIKYLSYDFANNPKNFAKKINDRSIINSSVEFKTDKKINPPIKEFSNIMKKFSSKITNDCSSIDEFEETNFIENSKISDDKINSTLCHSIKIMEEDPRFNDNKSLELTHIRLCKTDKVKSKMKDFIIKNKINGHKLNFDDQKTNEQEKEKEKISNKNELKTKNSSILKFNNSASKLKGPDFKKQVERVAYRSFLNMPIKAYDPKNKEVLSSSNEVTKYLHKINKELIYDYDNESTYKKVMIPKIVLKGPDENDILKHLNHITKIAEDENEDTTNYKDDEQS